MKSGWQEAAVAAILFFKTHRMSTPKIIAEIHPPQENDPLPGEGEDNKKRSLFPVIPGHRAQPAPSWSIGPNHNVQLQRGTVLQQETGIPDSCPPHAGTRTCGI